MAGLREVEDNIAHDHTLLNRFSPSVALHEPYGEPAYREALEHTIEEADGLIKTFNALLSIARLEAGAGGDNKESLDVAALVRDVAELYEPVAEERGIVLRAEPVEPVYVRADRQLLGQAIANLIDNAIKYGAPDRAQGGNGSEPEVSVTTEARGPMAEIVVTDRGPGVPTSSASACSAALSGSRPAGLSRGRLGLEPRLGGGAAAWRVA